MTMSSLLAWSIYMLYAPLLAILLIVGHYALCRWMRRRGVRAGFYHSGAALGMAFQFVQALTAPSVAYVLAEKQKQQQDEDEDGDPLSHQARLRHFHRQLQRIRRGDPVERLVLRT